MENIYLFENGRIKQLPCIVDTKTGRIYPSKPTRRVKISELPKNALVVFNKNNFNSMQKNLNLAPAVGLTESANGKLGTARLEVAGISGTRRPLRIILDNQEATEQTVVIGDGYGLFATKNGIPVKAAGVIVGGTYGALTLDRLAEITKACPFDLHGYHLANTTTGGTSSENFLLNGQITQFVIAPDIQTVREVEIPISDEVEQSAQKDNIRSNKMYRFHLNGFSGWKLVIPAGEKVTFTLKELRAVGLAKDMVLLDYAS